jgi:anhydro-N-acetylmuramic acid kinase
MATLQIGDGDHFAVSNRGIITLSDFRQKHIAAGEKVHRWQCTGLFCVQ